MANLVINGTTFTPFSGGFTGTVPGTSTYYAEGGDVGPAPYCGPCIREEEDVTWNDVAGTAVRDRGFRFRPIYATVLFCGTVSSVNTAYKAFLDGMRGSADTIATRFTVSLPDGASFDGCKLAQTTEQRWENMSGKAIHKISLVLHQKSTTN